MTSPDLISQRRYEETAFVIPDGEYEFLKLPFGMINSGATHTHCMRKLHYMDDLLVHTQSWEDHMIALRELLERLVTANLTVRPAKCWIGWDWVELLGAGSRSWNSISTTQQDRQVLVIVWPR